MKELPFCYNVIKGSVCGESHPKKFHNQKIHQCKKCDEHLTNEDIIPLEFFEMLSFQLTMISMDESIIIAKEYGESYPAFDYDLFVKANSRIFNKLSEETKLDILNRLKMYGVRNSCFTSFAPNGTISYIAGMLSGGIEPVYALAYSRRIEKENKEYETVYIVDPIFEQHINNIYNENEREEILKYIVNNNGSCKGCKLLTEEEQDIFITAKDLHPLEHLEVLGVVAKNTSLSVSKTINLPESTTREDISNIYLKAHELGIIGVTVWRDNCKKGILSTNTIDKHDFRVSNAPKRPKELEADFYSILVHNNRFGVVVGLYDNKPYEIFALPMTEKFTDRKGKLVKVSKRRYDFVADNLTIENINVITEEQKAVTLLASLALRHGADIPIIIKTISKVSNNITDFSSAISRVLKKYIIDNQYAYEKCPDCGEKLVFESSCIICKSCGFSKCN